MNVCRSCRHRQPGKVQTAEFVTYKAGTAATPYTAVPAWGNFTGDVVQQEQILQYLSECMFDSTYCRRASLKSLA